MFTVTSPEMERSNGAATDPVGRWRATTLMADPVRGATTVTNDDRPPTSDEPDRGDADDGPPRFRPAPPIGDDASGDGSRALNLRVPLIDDGPAQQRRWTIALRLILIIPQAFALIFVGIATFFVGIVAWFSALFTGEVPDGVRSFLAMVVRWSTRVSAYLYLLSDVYPPFNGDDDVTYPIGVEIPGGVRLNQMAVLFRLVISIPAYILSSLIGGGLGVLLLPIWICSLVLGRLPIPLYRAIATATRFNARCAAYFLMLTPEYPGGWKGDGASVSPSTDDATPVGQTRFDFQLTSWSQAWIWIFIVLGLVSSRRGRLY